MRWIFRGFLVIIAVVVLGMTALFAIPTDRITERVVSQLAADTGRSVAIRGPVRPRLVPHLGIRAEGIEIGNPDWVEEGPMIMAQALDVGVAWAPLLRGQVELQTAELLGPRVILVRGGDGRVSWAFEGEAAPAETALPSEDTGSEEDGGATLANRITFQEISVTEAAVLFVDHASGRNLRYEPVSLSLTAEDGPIALAASVNEVTLQATVAELDALLGSGLSDLSLDVTWPGGELGFAGRAGLYPVFDGQLSGDVRDMQPLFALAGLDAPALPAGLGSDRIAIDLNVTLAEEGSLHIRDAQVELDGNAITADLDILPQAERPRIAGNIDLGQFVLPAEDAEAAPSGEGGGQANTAASPGWSEAPIDASALFSADADISLSASEITASGVSISDLSARLRNETGRMEIDLARATVFEGLATGALVANARNVFSARTDLTLTDIALSPAVKAFTGYERLEGTGAGRFELVGQGGSMAALMADLDGSGELQFGPGAIQGLDIAGMIRSFDAGFQGEGARTVYDGIGASFTVTDGLLRNDDLAMEAPWGAIRGAGEVNIGARSMDYLVTPGLSARDDGTARVNVPVRIEGPWHDLSYRPDLEALAEQELSGQIDALEDSATDALRGLVNDELGLDIEQGARQEDAVDQIEDALQERLQDSLQDGLRSLFD